MRALYHEETQMAARQRNLVEAEQGAAEWAATLSPLCTHLSPGTFSSLDTQIGHTSQPHTRTHRLPSALCALQLWKCALVDKVKRVRAVLLAPAAPQLSNRLTQER
jgi:hypothetical protein